MSRITKKVLSVVCAAVVSAGILFVTPSGASAATSCYWQSFGQTSNCDGLYKHQTTCASNAYVAYSRQLRSSDGIALNIWVQLWYSPSCRTTWAMIPSNGYPADQDQTGCYAQIVRNSDSQSYREPVDPGIDFAYTRMVYDANVTSYAFANCDTGVGRQFSATTPSY